MKKRFNLTFCTAMKDGNEKLKVVQCDQWVEMFEDVATPVIYCLNKNKDSAEGYPSQFLRKVRQNFGVLQLNTDNNINNCEDRSYV